MFVIKKKAFLNLAEGSILLIFNNQLSKGCLTEKGKPVEKRGRKAIGSKAL